MIECLCEVKYLIQGNIYKIPHTPTDVVELYEVYTVASAG